jgi:hypothetical protein
MSVENGDSKPIARVTPDNYQTNVAVGEGCPELESHNFWMDTLTSRVLGYLIALTRAVSTAAYLDCERMNL